MNFHYDDVDKLPLDRDSALLRKAYKRPKAT